MNRDDITRMTLEANGRVTSFINYDFGEEVALFYLEELERFAALVAAAEREACAKACEKMADNIYSNSHEDSQPMPHAVAKFCAAAIRARGET
jgi:hypothetical protein